MNKKGNKAAQSAYNTLSNEEIIEALHSLRLPGMLATYLEQEKIIDIGSLSFRDRFGMLLYEELQGRNTRRQARLFKESGIRTPAVHSTSLIYSKERNLDQNLVEELLTCRWIKSDNPPNVVVCGAAGTGKSYLIATLGKCATMNGLSVSYWRFPQLLEAMTEAFNRNESSTLRRKINSKRLLIIDDFAMAPLNDQMRTDLLSLIDDRLGVQATIIAAQLPFRNWYKYIGEAYHADALIDRLKNHSYHINLKGPSMRERSK